MKFESGRLWHLHGILFIPTCGMPASVVRKCAQISRPPPASRKCSDIKCPMFELIGVWPITQLAAFGIQAYVILHRAHPTPGSNMGALRCGGTGPGFRPNGPPWPDFAVNAHHNRPVGSRLFRRTCPQMSREMTRSPGRFMWGRCAIDAYSSLPLVPSRAYVTSRVPRVTFQMWNAS